jgi:hypothetical protein
VIGRVGKKQKEIRAKELTKEKNSCKEESKEKYL